MRLRLTALAIALAGMTMAFTVAAQAALTVTWMPGVTSPGTPARLDRVGVIKVGPAHARNVLVIEPGTSAGGAYFVPVARWIVSRATGWQVWSVERRENRLEDQSELDLAKRGGATATQVFDYYLGWIRDPSLTPHVTGLPAASYAKRWGMAVAVGDVHRVITAARRLGGKVVLGGHSLGGGGRHRLCDMEFRRPSRRRPAHRARLHRRRQRVVLPATALDRSRGRRQRRGERGATRAAPAFDARPRASAIAAHLRLRRAARRTDDPRRGGHPGPSVTHSPLRVTLVGRHATYAHNDPVGAYPRNAFFSHLIPFLRTVSATTGG